MTLIHEYRIRCTTDDKWEYWWLPEDASAPTTCPVDSGHTVANPVLVKTTGMGTTELDTFIGGQKTIGDGTVTSMTASSWARAELTLYHDAHLQTVKIRWKNCEVGDYGWLALIHPTGETTPQSTLSADDTTVTVGTGLGAVYAAAEFIEFWDDSDAALIEMAGVQSVSGDVVTLTGGLKNGHSTSATLRCILKSYTQVRGDNSIDGGFKMISGGQENYGSENQMTEMIPTGLVIGARFSTSAPAATREITVNYKLREAL